MAITVSEFKFNWRGQWQTSQLYNKNDIVQFNNAAYVCLQNTPDEWKIAQEKSVDTTTNYIAEPEIYFVDKRPDVEGQYWRLIVRGNTFKRGWMQHRVYNYGDIVRYGGDLYMYYGITGSGAAATATINGQGQVVAINVTSGGVGYNNPPQITIGFDSTRQAFGAQATAIVSNGTITQINVTHPGSGYTVAPSVFINTSPIRNTCPEDPTYWVRIFQNPARDTRRLYGVATANQQPLGWTRNYGDFPNPQVNDGNQVAWIGADGVPYSNGYNAGGYNTGGRGVVDWAVSWQPSAFTFADWLRSTDVAPSLGLVALNSTYLPTPDGLPPRCTQWLKNQWNSVWLFNNGEVYSSGYADSNGQTGNLGTSTVTYTTRVTNNSLTGWLNETLPRSFNQTKIVKLDGSTLGTCGPSLTAAYQWQGSSVSLSNNSSSSWYAVGYDGSLWSWGYNAYGQLGLGQQVIGASITGFTTQTQPYRIPAIYFDYKKIVDVMAFGANFGSVLALDEDGELWGWGSDYSGELGLGGGGPIITGVSSTQSTTTVTLTIPTQPTGVNPYVTGQVINVTGSTQAIQNGIFTITGTTGTTITYTTSTGSTAGGSAIIVTGVVSPRQIPTKIPFDFRKFGGIKKMAYSHYNGQYNERFVVILTNDGTLFGAGAFPQNLSPTTPLYVGSANQIIMVNRFTRFTTTGGQTGAKQVENFWIVGDSHAPNIFIREKDTGLTYGAGDNFFYTVSATNTNYSSMGTGGGMGPWSLIKGPRNVVAVTMNEAGSSSNLTTPYSYMTVMMLDESGRAWGQGRNYQGSLSLGFSGNSYDNIQQNPETGGFYNYQPIKMPSNTRIATIMGFGHALPGPSSSSGYDLAAFITDDGQVLYCGSDGTNQTAATGSVQGAINQEYAYKVLSGSNNATNRYTMHSLMGD